MNILAELGPAARRVRRGWERVVLRRRPVTPGHEDNARETNVMLRLMREAQSEPTLSVDQQLMLSQSAVGMRQRAAVLLGIPNRSLVEERELVAINGWLAEEAARNAPAPVIVPRQQSAPLGFLGPLAANPMAGILMSPVTWVAAAFAIPAAFGAVQTARLNHAKHELTETRDDLERAIHERDDWHDRASRYAQAVTDARETAEATAQALNQERRRQAAAARRERERQRDVQNILAGSHEPPPWDERLRNDQPVQE